MGRRSVYHGGPIEIFLVSVSNKGVTKAVVLSCMSDGAYNLNGKKAVVCVILSVG